MAALLVGPPVGPLDACWPPCCPAGFLGLARPRLLGHGMYGVECRSRRTFVPGPNLQYDTATWCWARWRDCCSTALATTPACMVHQEIWVAHAEAVVPGVRPSGTDAESRRASIDGTQSERGTCEQGGRGTSERSEDSAHPGRAAGDSIYSAKASGASEAHPAVPPGGHTSRQKRLIYSVRAEKWLHGTGLYGMGLHGIKSGGGVLVRSWSR